MCTSPLKILNPVKYPSERSKRYGYLNKYLVVPCGKCDECRAMRHEEIGSLSYAEFRDADLTLFYTLTYRDEMLPVYNVYTRQFGRGRGNVLKSDYVDGNIPCFSRDDIQRFYKNIRIRLDRYFASLHIPSPRIHYMNCCEYGKGSSGSHRPHYHGMIYFSWLCGSYSRLDSGMKELIKSHIESVIESSWCLYRTQLRDSSGRFSGLSSSARLGMVSGSKSRGYWCNSYVANYYVSKYSTKDLSFFEQPLLKEWCSKDPNIIFDMRNCLPRMTHSKNFGYGLLDDFVGKSSDAMVKMLVKGFEIPEQTFLCGEVFNHPYPRNIVRKLFFNTNYDLVFKYDDMREFSVSEEEVVSHWTLSQKSRSEDSAFYYFDVERQVYESRFARLRARLEFKESLLKEYLKVQDFKDRKFSDKVYELMSKHFLDASLPDGVIGAHERADYIDAVSSFSDSDEFYRYYRYWKYCSFLCVSSYDVIDLDEVVDEMRVLNLRRGYEDMAYHSRPYLSDVSYPFSCVDDRYYQDNIISSMQLVMDFYSRLSSRCRALNINLDQKLFNFKKSLNSFIYEE